MKRESLIIPGLVAITLAAFWGVGKCDFVNFDDYGYIVNNPHVTSGLSKANFVWAWITFEQGNYLPLTWLSFMLDATLFGSGPHGFHWVNLAFHIANSILVFLFFRHATGAVWRSALVAAIFAVHPLRVESVAWVVERKDVLTGFFCLLTMLAYLRYTRELKWTWYAVVLLLFAATLLAKQVLATLPCVLLLLDYWPLGRCNSGPAPVGPDVRPRQVWWQLVLEKLPMVAMAGGIIAVTMKAQASTHSIADLKVVSLGWRLANVPVSYARYLAKMVWFGNLAPFYPRQPWTATQVAASILLLLIITAICLWKLRSSPWLAVGWFWFLGVLVPMIGVLQFGPQAMADRFTYLSGIGLLVMLAWSLPAPREQGLALSAAAGTGIGLLILFTLVQTRYWRSSVTLSRHDIAAAGSNRMAEFILGKALRDRGDSSELPEAISHLKKALRFDPANVESQGELALALALDNQCDQALPLSLAAVHKEPDNANWQIVLAYIRLQQKQYPEAASQSRKALRLNPRSAYAHHLLGIALCEMGELQPGIQEIKLALSIKPNLKDGQRDLQHYQILATSK